jgi:hypothetical protein
MKHLVAAALLATTSPAFAAGVDALTATVRAEDADRFVAVYEAANGAPSAEALDSSYIAPGSDGLKIFTPGRIENGENLADAIAANPAEYRRAIDVCLPIAKASSDQLRAVYLAMDGLLGDPALPEIHVLFGAGNSGGTAGPGAQVLGLEVLCRGDKDEVAIRALFRSFFAHETVHTLQPTGREGFFAKDTLLTAVLMEGTADYIAFLVTGEQPSPYRATWATAREAEIWNAFKKDRRASEKAPLKERFASGAPLYRWIANAGSAPEGWPDELGYWLGMQIAAAYVEKAGDRRAAIKELIDLEDAALILEKSGYAKRFD